MPTDPRIDAMHDLFKTPILPQGQSWDILVVDDEPEVFEATRFALRGVRILDRQLTLHRAESAAQAEAMMAATPTMAAALVDVVMETHDAGLNLVSRLRETGYEDLRIILRTGQPGYAPELSVIRDFDINDYRCKDEMTRTRLISVLTGALRDYSHIRQINEHRRGLGLVIDATRDLLNRRGLGLLGQGILTQLATLLGIPARGIVCAASMDAGSRRHDQFMVLAGLGAYAKDLGRPLVLLADYETRLASAFTTAREVGDAVVLDDGLAAVFDNPSGRAYFLFIAGRDICPSAIQHDLLRLFTNNIALCFENVDMVERLDGLAFTDPGLKIPNRNALAYRVDQTKTPGRPTRLIVFSLDTLMDIASVFGTQTGIQAMLAYREAILEALPDVTFICRFSDRALVALGAPEDLDVASIQSLRDPSVPVEGMPMALPATISVLDLDFGHLDAEDVIRMAITADLSAPDRRDLDGLHHYDPSVKEALAERLRLLFALRDALERNEGIEAHFQAKVNMRTGEIQGAEALCRWTLDGQPISPGAFIPLAETGGLSSRLTQVMLEQVAAFAKGRAANGHPPIPIAVNLSLVDFQTSGFADRILGWVDSLGLGPDRLSFEITESEIMRDPESTLRDLERLRDAGYELAMDDFGTGYSSLARIHRIPIATLKIDRAFVTPLSEDNKNQGIAAVTLTMARNLGLDVVAEGVETPVQARLLVDLGCETAQGFLYAKPMARDAFEDLLDGGPLPLP